MSPGHKVQLTGKKDLYLHSSQIVSSYDIQNTWIMHSRLQDPSMWLETIIDIELYRINA